MEKLVVKEISIVNEEGEEIISLGEWESQEGRLIEVFDGEGTTRASVNPGAIQTYYPKGEPGTHMTSIDLGTSIGSNYKNGSSGINLSTIDKSSKRSSSISLNDADEEIKLYMKGTKEGTMTSFYGPEGKSELYIEAAKGGSKMAFYNSTNDKIVNIGPTANGHGGIWVFDRDGENERSYGHNRGH